MFQRFQDTKMQETDESQLPTASSSELTADTAAPLYRHQQLLSYASNGDYRNGSRAFVCTATYEGTDERRCNISKAESDDYGNERHESNQSYSEKCLSRHKEEPMFSNALHHDVMKSTAEETETYRVNLQTTCDKFISSGLLRVAANPEKLIVEALRAPEMLEPIPCSESSSLNETDYKNILDNSQQTYLKSSEEHQYMTSKQDSSLNDQLDIRLNNSVSPDDFHDISPHHHSFQDAHSRSNVDAQRMVQESLKVYFPSESQSSLDDLGGVGSRLSNELTYSVQLNDTSRTDTCVNRNNISPSSSEQQINLHLNRSSSDPSQLVPENLCISEPQNHDIVDSEAVLSSVLSNRHRSTMANHLASQLPPCDSPMPPPESPMPLHISSHMLDASLPQQSISDHPPASPMQHTEAMVCQQPRTLESPLPSHFHGINVRPMDSAMPEHHLYQDRESSHIYSSGRMSVDTHNHARVNNSVDMLSPRGLDHYNGGGSLMERVSETPMSIHGDDSSMMCARSETPQMMVTQRQNYPLPPMRTHYDPSTHRVLQDTSHLMRDGMKYNNTGTRYINNGTMYRTDLIAHNGALSTPAPLTHSPMPGDPSPSSLAQYYTTSYSPHGPSQQYGAYLNSDQSVERGAMVIDDNKYDRMYHDIKPFDQEYHLPMNMNHEFQPDQSMQRLPKPKKPKEPKPPRMPVVHKCKECDRLFKNSTQLKNHMWRHTGEKPFTCDQCGSKFTQQGNLRAHRRIHTGERPYQCDVCKHCFTQLSTLKTHQKIHSDERPHKCTLCDAAFRQVANLKTHQVTHTGERPHQCDLCDKAFTQKSNLKAHKNRVHNPNLSYGASGRRGRRKNPTAIKPYCCSECGAKFTMMNNLKIHMKLHTGSRDYTCDLCGAGFSYRSNLKAHIQRMHNYDRTKKVKCDECPASFRLKRCLKSHKKKRHPIKSLKIKILGESKYFMRERSGPDLSEDIDESLLEEVEEGEDRSYLSTDTALETSSESLMEMKEPKKEPHELCPTELSADEARSLKVKEEVEENCVGNLTLDSKTAVSLVENFVSELDSERAASVYREESASVDNGTYAPGTTNGIERIKQQLAVNLDRLTEEYKSTSTKNRLNNNDIDVSSQSANNDEREKNTTANLP